MILSLLLLLLLFVFDTLLIVSAASLATRSIDSKIEEEILGIKLIRSLTIDTMALVFRDTQLLIKSTRNDPLWDKEPPWGLPGMHPPGGEGAGVTGAGKGLKGLPDVKHIIPP